MANIFVKTLTITLVLFAVHQAYTNSHIERVLTPEEEALAKDARETIVKTLRRNLIKFFTLVAADGGRGVFGRQDDDDYDVQSVTLNPNILPQVAQILGAIFAENLNLSAVIDQTVSLAPTVLRNQVDGIFKLLTGLDRKPTTAAPPKKRKTTTVLPPEEIFDVETTSKPTTAPTTVPTAVKAPNKSANKNRGSTLTPEDDYFEEDNNYLSRLQRELVEAAHDAEPYVRDKEPRFFLSSLNQIVRNMDSGRLNITQIVRFLPDLFQGARHAFTLLENLGKIAGVDLDDDDRS